jgi:putative ABC transport system permease protein
LGVLQVQDERTRQGLEGLLIADIATAQELLGRVGQLSHIDLAFPQGEAGERELVRLRAALPPGVEVIAASTRSQALGGMTRAFHQNLSALSLLALVVGMFLIYNTLTFAVVQRRALIGSLRSLGVTRGEVFGLVLGEALLVGAIGTVAGVLLGVLLAHALLDLVTRTINDLYFVLTVRDLAITPQVLLKGVALGLGGSLLAGIAPAHEATTAPPRVVLSRSTLELRLRHGAPRMALAGLVLLSVSAALLLLSGTSLLISYLALLAIILGFALLIPILTVGLMWGLQPALGRLFGILGSLAARGVVASLSRTAVAIAALAVAVSATIGLGIMIGSFRDTVVHWLEHTLRADLYVSPRDEASTDGGLAPALVQRLASVPGIASCSTSRVVQIESASGLTHIVALNIGPVAYPAFRFKQGDVRAIWPAFQQGGAVIVSESYAYCHGLRVGSRVRLRTDRGVHAFPVAGVYYAYGTDQGVVTMNRKTYDRFWDDRGISAMGVYAAPGTDIAALKHSLLRIAAAWPGVQVRSNRAILELSLDIFDRTFAVTEVLRLLAGLVAFLGVLSALMALQLERTRELGVLRALGLTPSQLRALVDSQTGLMGLVAGLLALPLGMVMALVLIRVINRHSFGWTLEIHLSPEVLVQGLLLALVAALLAGVYPAFRMARTSPAEALREE